MSALACSPASSLRAFRPRRRTSPTGPRTPGRRPTHLRAKALAGIPRHPGSVAGLTDRAGPGWPAPRAIGQAVAWATRDAWRARASPTCARKGRRTVWQRGEETGEVVSPWPQRLALTALGGSVADAGGRDRGRDSRGPSLEDLEGKSPAAAGKIVFFNKTDGTHRRRVRLRPGRGRALQGTLAGGAVRRPRRPDPLDRDRSQPAAPHRRPPLRGEAAAFPAAALSVPDAERSTPGPIRGGAVRVRFRLTCGDKGRGRIGQRRRRDPGRRASRARSCCWARTWTRGTSVRARSTTAPDAPS